MTALGYCGINCDECPAYRGTVATDIALLEQVAGTSWSGAQSAPDWVCLGCTPASQQVLAADCATCSIRACAVARKAQNCAACDDYESCRLLRDASRANHPEGVTKRMDWLRERFLALRGERGG